MLDLVEKLMVKPVPESCHAAGLKVPWRDRNFSWSRYAYSISRVPDRLAVRFYIPLTLRPEGMEPEQPLGRIDNSAAGIKQARRRCEILIRLLESGDERKIARIPQIAARIRKAVRNPPGCVAGWKHMKA